MGGWGSRMLAAVQSAAELAAEGLGLPPTAFADRMACGPHLLAPTGERHLKKMSSMQPSLEPFSNCGGVSAWQREHMGHHLNSKATP